MDQTDRKLSLTKVFTTRYWSKWRSVQKSTNRCSRIAFELDQDICTDSPPARLSKLYREDMNRPRFWSFLWIVMLVFASIGIAQTLRWRHYTGLLFMIAALIVSSVFLFIHRQQIVAEWQDWHAKRKVSPASVTLVPENMVSSDAEESQATPSRRPPKLRRGYALMYSQATPRRRPPKPLGYFFCCCNSCLFFFILILVVIPWASPDPNITTFPDNCPIEKEHNCALVGTKGNYRVSKEYFPASFPALEDAQAKTRKWINKQYGVSVLVDNSEFLHARVLSKIMGYPDDVMFEFFYNSSTSWLVYMQSQSRLGRGDIGENPARIIKFYEECCHE
eukprot:g71657.t1